MNNIELLKALRPLTQEERQTAQAAARAAVIRDAGDRPERRQFQRELGSSFTLLDYLALVVFVAALAISSAHIIQYMKAEATESYQAGTSAGLYISQNVYALTHEIGAILLAESAAILFMTMHSMTSAGRANRRYGLRYLSIPLVLALMSAIFIFTANLSSGVNWLVSIMPPLFTLGIAVRLEQLIVSSLQNRDEVNRRYLQSLHDWETATAKPEHHPKYIQMYANALKDAIYKANSRREAAKALTIVEWRLLVKREIAADQWYEDVDLTEQPRPLPQVVTSASGNIPRDWGDHASILPMPTSNGHIAIENVTK